MLSLIIWKWTFILKILIKLNCGIRFGNLDSKNKLQFDLSGSQTLGVWSKDRFYPWRKLLSSFFLDYHLVPRPRLAHLELVQLARC